MNGNTHHESAPVGFLLIGVGPHAQRTYIPHLGELEQRGEVTFGAVVDVKGKQDVVEATLQTTGLSPEVILVEPFSMDMPEHVSRQLDDAVTRLNISVVVVSTEPLAHKAYGLWALSKGLNVIMDKPISARVGSCSETEAAYGLAQDYLDLLKEYNKLQRQKSTIFLVNSHRRYHPGMRYVFQAIREAQQATGCPVTTVSSTHCDGMWRMPAEIIDQSYHTFNKGYGKVSHSGYHFLDSCYQFLKAGWSENKRPDRIEVVSSFIPPNGFLTALNTEDYRRLFGAQEYSKACKYTDEQLRRYMINMGEIDASIQITAYRDGDAVTLAQVNLQHNGFSKRSYLKPGKDLYKGIGRVRHESHEIKSGPLQTVVIDSRQANDKHDRSKKTTAELGSDNHYDIHRFRNSDFFDGDEGPLVSLDVDDLSQHYNQDRSGLYGENIKRGILDEAVSFVNGTMKIDEVTSNLPDHSVAAHLMAASYLSHIQRSQGLNPIISMDLTYLPNGEAQASMARPLPSSVVSAELEQAGQSSDTSLFQRIRRMSRIFSN
ncbi:hypothetical protein F4808DRAFT_379246 [Astrocystis sublimbata]|nr:hypothetical protein F4808DRAFT_379246 [Astrocystis sublimbata]